MLVPTGQTGTDHVPGGGGLPRAYSYLLPVDYEREPERRYPLVLMLHGLTGSHLDWLAHTRLARHAAPYALILVMPDADDSYYTDAHDGHSDYETYLVGELLPHLAGAFRALEGPAGTGLIGLSMGGFGAVKLALRHPTLFGAAAAHSAALDRARRPNPPGEPHPVFGDCRENAELRRANDPYVLAERLAHAPQPPALYLDCGLQDDLLAGTRDFHLHLQRLGIVHTYAERPGYHTWPYWNRAVRSSLAWMAERLARSHVP